MADKRSAPVDLRQRAVVQASSDVRPVRHSALVRTTHWIVVLSFLGLLVSGVEILISHPRLYWGENGNVLKLTFRIPPNAYFGDQSIDVRPWVGDAGDAIPYTSAWNIPVLTYVPDGGL